MSADISVSLYKAAANETQVKLGSVEIAFSYGLAIGFKGPSGDYVTRSGEGLSKTTVLHIGRIDGGTKGGNLREVKARRLPAEEFERALSAAVQVSMTEDPSPDGITYIETN